MKNPDLVNILKQNFSGQSQISTKEITDALQEQFPELSPSTIAWRLNQLKKEQLLFQVGRGLYTFDYKPEFSSDLSLKSKRLYNRIKTVYNGEIVMWDTSLLSEISGIDISKYWVFLALNKDALDGLFDEMLAFSKKVYLQPDKETAARYLFPQEEAIILTALVSETPLVKSGDYLSPSIEGILVNAWFESEQYLQPLGLNINTLFQQAYQKYNINQSKLLRYAARRDKRKEINDLLKSIA
jgi:hypothetical protein